MSAYLPLLLALASIAAAAGILVYVSVIRPRRLRISSLERDIVSLCSRGIITNLAWGCSMKEMGVDFLLVEGAGWRFEPLLVSIGETYAAGQVPREVKVVFRRVMDGPDRCSREIALLALERVHHQRNGVKVFAVNFAPEAGRTIWSSVQRSRARSHSDHSDLRNVS
jgi:hypothetical protein